MPWGQRPARCTAARQTGCQPCTHLTPHHPGQPFALSPPPRRATQNQSGGESGADLGEAGEEGRAGGRDVLLLSLPHQERLVLERAGEAEGEWPRCLLFMRKSCNRREVLRCLIRRLSTGEEQDTGDLLRHALRA